MSYRILVVDDEKDVHTITQLSLKSLSIDGTKPIIDYVTTGRDAVAYVAENPDTAVILMDVVMEQEHAGLKAVEAIRNDLHNDFVRILLRTGQPGLAPEREVIDHYNIDGYMSKAELTNTRIYTAVRTALKNYSELLELQHHRDILDYLNASVLELHECQNLENCLQQLTELTMDIVLTDLCVLSLELGTEDSKQEYQFFSAPSTATPEVEAEARLVATGLKEELAGQSEPAYCLGGFATPLKLLDGLGQGWLYVKLPDEDPFAEHILPILAAHSAIAIYLKAQA